MLVIYNCWLICSVCFGAVAWVTSGAFSTGHRSTPTSANFWGPNITRSNSGNTDWLNGFHVVFLILAVHSFVSWASSQDRSKPFIPTSYFNQSISQTNLTFVKCCLNEVLRGRHLLWVSLRKEPDHKAWFELFSTNVSVLEMRWQHVLSWRCTVPTCINLSVSKVLMHTFLWVRYPSCPPTSSIKAQKTESHCILLLFIIISLPIS